MPITTHGRSYTPEYRTWHSMKARCSPTATGKHRRNYYERGIRVCQRWLNSFENFFEDMGERPSPMHSIDRIDNDGNYEPSNCRWSTPVEQIANQRRRQYKSSDDRYIRKEPSGSYRLIMELPSGYRYARVFRTYKEAVDMRSQIESERTMYHLLGG